MIDIGTKIKEARLGVALTQEQTAEALGVSRQTISNWENGKTYPDIVSIVKMSDLYGISLDDLLKGKEQRDMSDYVEYLGESTDTVKSNQRLSLIITLSLYFAVWAATLIIAWLFIDPVSTFGFAVVFFWGLLPVSTFITSALIGGNDFFGKLKWICPIVFGIMYSAADLLTFKLMHVVGGGIPSSPDMQMVLWGTAIAAVGLVIGTLFRLAARKRKTKSL